MSETAGKCAICNEDSENYCKSCGTTFYCSVECRETDQSLHEVFCKVYTDFIKTNRPANSVLAIKLDANQALPAFVWVPYNEETYVLELGKYMDPETMGQKIVESSFLRGYALDHFLSIHHINLTIDTHQATPVNQAVDNFVKGFEYANVWKGDLVVSAGDKVDEVMQPKDVSLTDLRVVVDHFRFSNMPSIFRDATPTHRLAPTNKIWGVKIVCLAEMEETGLSKYEQVAIPLDHPIFTLQPSLLSVGFELPLLAQQYARDESWDGNAALYDTEEARLLQRVVDPNDASWGRIPSEWRGPVSSVLVVRSDKKDILPCQLWAFVEFCAGPLKDEFEKKGVMDYDLDKRISWTQSNIMKVYFLRYFFDFRDIMAKTNMAWASVNYPY